MELLKKIFDLWSKTNWIRTIEKERRKLVRMQDAVKRQRYVVNELTLKFLELYPPKEEHHEN